MKSNIEQQLKECLQKKYVDSNTFLNDIIYPVFGEDNFESSGNLNVLRKRPELQSKADATGIIDIRQVGCLFVEGSQLDIFDIKVDYKKQLHSNRVEIQKIIRSILDTHSGAFIIFHYESGARWEWRFTFCHKGASQLDSTDAKRYTFLLGPGQSCRTAAENFLRLHDKIEREGEFEMDDIIKAFDVEALSKEFFAKYKMHYERFCQFVYDNKDNCEYFGEEFSKWEDKIIRDYVKKLLGRIVFLHFLQKKGWMGVPADKQWGEGDTQFMKHLFESSTIEQKNNYLDNVLEPLFSEALNTQRENDIYDLHVEGFTSVKIPYLNGGLFELDELDAPKSKFPSEYFADLFEFFYQYNFTIDENDPNDAEVGIDPEMLGRIFENLLEDNKDKGAFYTPKEIVKYMCRESLIAYLTTCVLKKQGDNHKPEDEIQKAIRDLLNEPEKIAPKMNAEQLQDFGSYIRKVKICDPAIGSGAFPMGLLNELVRCRVSINAWANDAEGNLLFGNYAALKSDIICNNIYGVDIEKGAIDIARLRFWLSIIVDEQEPHALPNFDYKFMQGNSLIPTFCGEYINIGKAKSAEDKKKGRNTTIEYTEVVKYKRALYDLKKRYYVAEGDEKLQLAIDIKEAILNLIALQIKNEMKSWIDAQSQTSLFEESTPIVLPPDKQRILDTGKQIRTRLSDTTISLKDRAQTDIQFFDWHIMFTEVFDVKDENGKFVGGFDIVIGNPPYGYIFKDKEMMNTMLSLYSTAEYKVEAYSIFAELGISKLREKGVLCYITPYTYVSGIYFSKFREYLNNYNMNTFVVLGKKIFETAEVDTGIYIVTKESKHEIIRLSDVREQDNDKKLVDIDYWTLSQNKFYAQYKNVLLMSTEKNVDLYNKLYAHKNVSLLSECIEFYHGIQTRGNKNSLLQVREFNSFPIIKGADFNRYTTAKPENYIIPSKETIKSGGEIVKYTSNPEKILVRTTADRIVATIDTTKSLTLNSVNIANLRRFDMSLYAILGIMNSKLMDFWYRLTVQEKNKTFAEVKIVYLERMPILYKQDIWNKIEIKVKNILTLSLHDELENEIDLLVYDLYGLTPEEIAIVEGTKNA